jgi:hypothetical protein
VIEVRWVGFAAGVLVVLSTMASVLTTIVVPRGVSSRISAILWRGTETAFLTVARRLRRYESQDRLLALMGPFSLLVLLIGWLVLFLVGFGLIFWPIAGDSFAEALRLSGSSLFTLGFVAARPGPTTIVSFFAAASGLGVVALQLGYLPTIYSAYNRRETLVNMLESRAGEPAWGPELIARQQLIDGIDSLARLFADWERWVADIAETHASYPWLLAFRSSRPRRSWLVSIIAVLDAAALFLALSPSRAPTEARYVLRTGFIALADLAEVSGATVDRDPKPDDPISLTRAEFDEALALLQRAGFPFERDPDTAWTHFRGWRVNYERAAYALASVVTAVPAPWSGERQLGRATVPVTRPRHRSPDDPEGKRAAVTLGHLVKDAGGDGDRDGDRDRDGRRGLPRG